MARDNLIALVYEAISLVSFPELQVLFECPADSDIVPTVERVKVLRLCSEQSRTYGAYYRQLTPEGHLFVMDFPVLRRIASGPVHRVFADVVSKSSARLIGATGEAASPRNRVSLAVDFSLQFH